MSTSGLQIIAATLTLNLFAPISCVEAPDSAPSTEAPAAAEAASPHGGPEIALRIEQAERDLDAGRAIPAARQALSEVLAASTTTPEQRDRAKLAMSRVLEAEGDREAATTAVEALLAEHPAGRGWPLQEAAEKRLGLLVTGSEEEPEPELSEHPGQISPFARALARYFPVPEAGPREIPIDAFIFGGSSAVSERLGTFAVGPAIRELRKEACPRCDERLLIKSSFSKTGRWLGIPQARARLGSSLAVFYFDLGSGRIPARYDAELPLPSAEIVARLSKGEGLIAVREREGAPPAVLIAAPRKAQLAAVETALAAMSSPPAAPVAVPLQMALTAEEIQGVVRSAFPTYRTCYEELLHRSPAAAGSILLKFAVQADGLPVDARVDAAATTLHDAALEDCMVTATRALTFPAAGERTTVTYPIAFSPGE